MNTRSLSLLPIALSGATLLLGACSDDDSTDPFRETIEALSDVVPEFGDPVFDDPDPTIPEGPETTLPPVTAVPPETATDPSPLWRLVHEGTLRGRYKIGGDDSLVFTLSREFGDQVFLTGVSPKSGEELWRVADVSFSNCFPALLGTGHVVAQLDRTTAAGGDDNSDDLALIDGESGAVIDTWEPDTGNFIHCTSDNILVADGDQLVHTNRGLQYGFTTTDDTLEPSWERNWSRDADTDPIAGGRTPSFFDDAAIVGERFYMGATELHSDGFAGGVTLYQLDASTGRAAGRLELPLLSLSGIQVAGPGELLVTGLDKDRREYRAVLVGGAGAGDPADSLEIRWQRTMDGNGDGVTDGISADAIAVSDGAFASWAATDAGATVTEFDLATGQAAWSARTSSFSNNDSIAALPAGGYAVFPFGGNFVEAFDENGDPAWEIATVEGHGFASAMGVYAGNLVMVGATDEGWGFVGIGPLPGPALAP